MNTNEALLDYIKVCPNAYFTTIHNAKVLEEEGYTRLTEGSVWNLVPGKGYFVTRSGTSLIAFRLPETKITGWMIAAAHGDNPTFRVKENPDLADPRYTRLSVERYGGMLCSSWMDRPLSIAGRLLVRSQTGLKTVPVDFKEPCAVIPNVAIHMNRNANDGMKYDLSRDMLPMVRVGKGEKGLVAEAAEKVGVSPEDVVSSELYLYNPDRGCVWSNLLTAPRIDDLGCAFAALYGFLNAKLGTTCPVYCCFDNEEVGSQTKQGAASTFLTDVLARITAALNMSEEERILLTAHSMMASCDNGHAVHPNHPEYADANHTSVLNGGVVIKHNASQKYTTDAVSSALFQEICRRAGVPFQHYANRADLPGGSTLGNISNTHVSMNTVDIGMAQLAMHSAMETMGAEDAEYMVRALTAFYNTKILQTEDGIYSTEAL